MHLILIVSLSVALLLLVSVSFIRIHFRYERHGEDDHLTIGIAWLRYLRFTVPVSPVDLRARRKREMTVRLKIMGAQGEISLPDTLHAAGRNFGRFRRSLRYAAARTRVKKLEWCSEFGLADAACTGVAAGLAWSLKSAVLTAVSAYTHLETVPRIRVRPNFQKAFLHTLFDCIFEIRIGHIMIAGLKAIRPG